MSGHREEREGGGGLTGRAPLPPGRHLDDNTSSPAAVPAPASSGSRSIPLKNGKGDYRGRGDRQRSVSPPASRRVPSGRWDVQERSSTSRNNSSSNNNDTTNSYNSSAASASNTQHRAAHHQGHSSTMSSSSNTKGNYTGSSSRHAIASTNQNRGHDRRYNDHDRNASSSTTRGHNPYRTSEHATTTASSSNGNPYRDRGGDRSAKQRDPADSSSRDRDHRGAAAGDRRTRDERDDTVINDPNDSRGNASSHGARDDEVPDRSGGRARGRSLEREDRETQNKRPRLDDTDLSTATSAVRCVSNYAKGNSSHHDHAITKPSRCERAILRRLSAYRYPAQPSSQSGGWGGGGVIEDEIY